MAPRWIVGLLARVVPTDWQDEVIGDLEELHGRRVERWGVCPRPHADHPGGHLVDPGELGSCGRPSVGRR